MRIVTCELATGLGGDERGGCQQAMWRRGGTRVCEFNYVCASLRARATADRLDVKYSNKIWLLVVRLVGASVGFVGGAKGTARLFTHALTHRFGNGALCLCVRVRAMG